MEKAPSVPASLNVPATQSCRLWRKPVECRFTIAAPARPIHRNSSGSSGLRKRTCSMGPARKSANTMRVRRGNQMTEAKSSAKSKRATTARCQRDSMAVADRKIHLRKWRLWQNAKYPAREYGWWQGACGRLHSGTGWKRRADRLSRCPLLLRFSAVSPHGAHSARTEIDSRARSAPAGRGHTALTRRPAPSTRPHDPEKSHSLRPWSSFAASR